MKKYLRDKESFELRADLIKYIMSATTRRGFQVATKNHYSLDTNLKLAISPLQSVLSSQCSGTGVVNENINRP